MAPIQTVLFDLDGTLIDSIHLILSSYHHTLARHGLGPATDAEWLRGVGRPLRVQLAPWAQAPEDLEELVATYRAYNLANHDQMVQQYPGVTDLVRQLHTSGRRLGVVTSKNREGTKRGLRLAGLEEMFEVLVCADDVTNPKPHPEPVERAVAQLQADPGTTVYVGDSIHDLHSGRAAGVRTAAVLWGPFGRADLESGAPDWWVETPADLFRVILG